MGASSADHATVTQLHVQLRQALLRSFPSEVWVAGEVASFRRAGDRLYFDLVDRPAPFKPPSALVKCVVHPQQMGVYYQRLKSARVKLEDGVQLRVRCKVTSYAPQGVVQLQCVDVDPTWTVGHMAQSRDAVLSQLQSEGSSVLQSRLVLPPAALRVAVLSSRGSHAEADFLSEIGRSLFAFDVSRFDVLVQGEGAARSIAAQLDKFAADQGLWDVVCVVRGGGSRTDLAAFDDIELARAVCRCRVPVIVGIGHELDRSVVDEVAFASLKTPTATAQFLVEHVAREHARLLGQMARCATLVDARMQAASQFVAQVLPRVRSAVLAGLEKREQRVGLVLSRVGQSARVLLDQRERMVADRWGSLSRQVRPALGRAVSRLDGTVNLLDAVSPAATLRRGFSLSRTIDGRLVRSVEDVDVGVVVVTSVGSGSFESRVEGVANG